MKDFKDRVCVVTGAASGIGEACAERFAQEGASVVLADIDEEGVRRVAERIERAGRRSLAVPTDVTRLEDIQRLRDSALEAFSRVDLVMNNAGAGIVGGYDKTPLEEWEQANRLLFMSVVYGVHLFLPHFLERGGGHFVNTASMAGLIGIPWHGPYTTAKHAVVGLSESLYGELYRRGIRVTVVCPGLVRTGIFRRTRVAGKEMDMSRDPEVAKALRRFDSMEPSRAAAIIARAVKRERLVCTTGFPAAFFYRWKRFFPRTFYIFMRSVGSRMAERVMERTSADGVSGEGR